VLRSINWKVQVFPVGETNDTLRSDAGSGVRDYQVINKHERYYAGHPRCHRRSSPGVRAILHMIGTLGSVLSIALEKLPDRAK